MFDWILNHIYPIFIHMIIEKYNYYNSIETYIFQYFQVYIVGICTSNKISKVIITLIHNSKVHYIVIDQLS